jgi:hypothetical protein
MLTADREPQPTSVENREQRRTQSHWQFCVCLALEGSRRAYSSISSVT